MSILRRISCRFTLPKLHALFVRCVCVRSSDPRLHYLLAFVVSDGLFILLEGLHRGLGVYVRYSSVSFAFPGSYFVIFARQIRMGGWEWVGKRGGV